MTLTEFHALVGETVMRCQHIEEEVKMIYAILAKGDFDANYAALRRDSLGQVLIALRELDASDGRPFISAADYEFLLRMKNRRNHWCHEAYISFIYIDDFASSAEYQHECRQLLEDSRQLRDVSLRLENARVKAFEIYRRT
ncbi:MAG: hypothetical protein IKM08_08600 [Clostridia bacterium]|nr:hypothetical protein [Clostridia bacterium]